MPAKAKSAAMLLALALVFPYLARASSATAAVSTANQALRSKIASYLRQRFSITDSTAMTVGPLLPSIYAGFDKTIVVVENGKDKASQSFYVSKDGQYLVQGNIYSLNVDPRKEVESLIRTEDQPATGPADAPVTIVEYADLECPVCAEMQQVIETQLAPRYGDKLRVIYKEFPLFSIHPWAVAAAAANQCAYQINPADYVSYRSLIFKNQKTIQQGTATQQLLDLSIQAGLDRTKMSACLDSKQALPRVRQDFLEGQKLGVASTPTFFINGKMIAGQVPVADLFKAVDQALAEASAK
ncbi:MAG: thioredoxin domain-containing protein [Terriglobia bacterium]